MTEKKFRYWFIGRGNFSSQEAIMDIQEHTDIDNYETRISYIMIEKFFDSLSELKKFKSEFIKWAYPRNWSQEADMTTDGIEILEDGNYVDYEEEEEDENNTI